MEKSEIYKIFVAGINFGLEYGHFPKTASMFDHHASLTKKCTDDERSVMWTVIIAGDNYGSNARGVVPSEEKMKAMFENLIAGKPLEDDDNAYYTIKDKIDRILTSTGDGNS